MGLFLCLAVVCFVLQGLRDQRERQVAEQAVRRAGEGAEVAWVVDASRSRAGRGSHRTVWCGKVERVNGLVAVRTIAFTLPFLEHVERVETAWLAPRILDEDSLLYKCRQYRR